MTRNECRGLIRRLNLSSDPDCRDALALVREIAAAAGRVQCARCHDAGTVKDTYTGMGVPCPDCTPLEELLEVVR